jgi:K+-sensing histidine kinase KdpD
VTTQTTKTILRAFLYGAGATLLLFDLFYLAQATITSQGIPITLIIGGILTTSGLLLILFAEHRERVIDSAGHFRLARVAHQLEMPLTSLLADFELLASHSHQLPAELRLKLKHMDTRTRRLLEHVRDAFLLLQAQQTTIMRDPRRYNVCVLVKEAIEKLRPFARARNTRLIAPTHCASAPVMVDQRLFLIALFHLIENAIFYTITPGMVNISVASDKKKVKITIQDRGHGLPRSQQFYLMQPFTRGQEAQQQHPDGLGVGLPLAAAIIQQSGGTLTYNARKDSMGTECIISLPIAGTEKERSQKDPRYDSTTA